MKKISINLNDNQIEYIQTIKDHWKDINNMDITTSDVIRICLCKEVIRLEHKNIS